MSLRGSLEAVLFSAGRGMTAQELGGAVGSPASDIEEALRTLADEYRQRDGGIGLSRGPSGLWSFEIRRRYSNLVEPHLTPELEGPELKTLSLIALMQPVEQTTLVERRGQRAYAHVRTLLHEGLVERRRKGRGFIIHTSAAFSRRFSLPFDADEMREKLGAPPLEPAGQTHDAAIAGGDAADAAGGGSDGTRQAPAPGADPAADIATATTSAGLGAGATGETAPVTTDASHHDAHGA